jgi:hypothetical protein
VTCTCISAHEGERGYTEWVKLGRRRTEVRVLLDGVELSKVISADEMRGKVVRYTTDEKGAVQVDPARGEVLTETLYGAVTILLPEGV